MGYIGKVSKAGEGQCGTPQCRRKKAPGRFVCKKHAKEMDRIKAEMEADPRLLWNQRSAGKKVKRPPTCSQPGCWEIRVPPSPYCDEHERA